MTNIQALVTVVTPTFNRSVELLRLYDSLCQQSLSLFIWHIYDDGSSDDTKLVAQSMISDNKIAIEYYYHENSGKHKVLNRFVPNIKTELMFVVDSDDYLLPDAIERIAEDWSKHFDINLIGMSYLRSYHDGEIIGDLFPSDYEISSHSEVRIVRGIKGDKAEVWLTKEYLKIPFIEFDNEKFFSEQYKYLMLSGPSQMIFINYPLYKCEYLDTGLSNRINQLQYENPMGVVENAKMLNQAAYPISIRAKGFFKLIAYGLLTDGKIIKLANDAGFGLVWIIVLLPPAFIYHCWVQLRYRLLQVGLIK